MNIFIAVYIKGFSGFLQPNLLKREEEMKVMEVCDECTQNCVLIHGQKKDPSPVVISFLKLLYGNYDFSKFLVHFHFSSFLSFPYVHSFEFFYHSWNY